MSGKICGYCTNWRLDEPLHLIGHCVVNRMEIPHGAICDTCTKYQSIKVCGSTQDLQQKRRQIMSEWKTTQPKKDGQYLITTRCGTKNVIDLACFTKNLYKIDHYDFSEYKGKRKAGWYIYDSEYGYVEYDDVLAWQELPLPYYKEEKNEI